MNFRSSDFQVITFSKEALKNCQTIQRMLDTSHDMTPDIVSLPFTFNQLNDAHTVLRHGSYGEMPIRNLYHILPVLDYMECPVHLKSVVEHVIKDIDDYRTSIELQSNSNTTNVAQKMVQYLDAFK